MSLLREPEDILSEFLRAEYKEPARSGLSKRHTNAIETFNGDNNITEFTVSNTNLLCINEIQLSAVKQTKYGHYDIDLRNNKIKFKTPPPIGVDNVSIDYDYGSESWIYPDKPRENLNRNKYPRIAIFILNQPSDRLAISDDIRLDNVNFQIDILTKMGIKATNFIEVKSDGTTTTVTETIEGERIVRILSRGIVNTIQRKIRNEIKKVLWDQRILGNTPVPFDEPNGIFRRTVEAGLKSFNIGEEQV